MENQTSADKDTTTQGKTNKTMNNQQENTEKFTKDKDRFGESCPESVTLLPCVR